MRFPCDLIKATFSFKTNLPGAISGEWPSSSEINEYNDSKLCQST